LLASTAWDQFSVQIFV